MFAIFPAAAAASALLICLTSAQVIISTTLPACARQCPILLQAQAGCVPPAAPVTNQGIYTSCFCLSAFLTPLSSNPVNVCPTCSQSDLGTLQSWFKGLCSGNPAAGGEQPVNPTPSTSSTTTSSPTAATPVATAQNAGGGSPISNNPPPDDRGWMASHWRWVLMLIILFLGFGAIAFAGRYFHRRYHRVHDGEALTAATRPPDLGTWGPGQSVHDFGAMSEGVPPPINEKGKSNDRTTTAAAPPPVPETSTGSRRLKKGWLARKG